MILKNNVQSSGGKEQVRARAKILKTGLDGVYYSSRRDPKSRPFADADVKLITAAFDFLRTFGDGFNDAQARKTGTILLTQWDDARKDAGHALETAHPKVFQALKAVISLAREVAPAEADHAAECKAGSSGLWKEALSGFGLPPGDENFIAWFRAMSEFETLYGAECKKSHIHADGVLAEAVSLSLAFAHDYLRGLAMEDAIEARSVSEQITGSIEDLDKQGCDIKDFPYNHAVQADLMMSDIVRRLEAGVMPNASLIDLLLPVQDERVAQSTLPGPVKSALVKRNNGAAPSSCL